MSSAYTSMQFQLWAIIDGKTTEIVQFACSYEMNTIPTCTAMLPVGYRVLPPFTAATSHEITKGVSVQIPMKVYCSVKYTSGTRQASIPADGTYLLFEGFVTGVGYRRTYDGYSMTIDGTHWLSNLSYSSILSAGSHPTNPTQFSFNSKIAAGSGAFNGAGLPVTLATEVMTAANMKANFWGNAIKPWFLKLASVDRMNFRVFLALGLDKANDTESKLVTSSLQRIDGTLQFDTTTFATGGDTVATLVGRDIGGSLMPTAQAVDQLANQTFWDKLIGQLAPTYMFSLIPFPSKATIVPFIPGLADVWDPANEQFTFKSRDIESQDMNCMLPRQLRAIGIFSGYGSAAGGTLPGGNANNYRVGGMFIPAGVTTGTVMFREAPSFLWQSAMSYRFSDQVTRVRGNAHNHPRAGQPDQQQPSPEAVQKDVRNALNDVAHATYVNEVLKNRWGDIATAINFDVAPGSSVKIEGTSGKFMQDGEARYGQVVRVAHYFDAQQQRCRSAFRIGYLHTEEEHDMDQFTIDAHPYYDNTWAGAKHITR